jgi:hypothetical protein
MTVTSATQRGREQVADKNAIRPLLTLQRPTGFEPVFAVRHALS